MNRIKELEKEIEIHNHNYWILNNPVISDIDFDKLIQELESIDSKHPLLSKHYFITQDNKVKHVDIILSLKKSYDKKELIKHLNKIVRNDKELLYIGPKYDGIFGILYNNKILATSGDGEYGDNISNKINNLNIITNLKQIPNILKGELILSNNYFKNFIKPNIKSKNGQEYKTPRNAVAGILNNKGLLQNNIKIDFIDYNYNYYEVEFGDLKQNITELDNLFKDVDYNMDGIVIKIIDNDYYNQLGKTSSHNKGSIAYKFINESKLTKIIDVDWNVGINNTITPTALLEPILINGVTISKVTLHNAKYIIDNNIKIGTIVNIERTSDATPTVLSCYNDNNYNLNDIIIEFCPACYSDIDYNEPELICNNPICIGMLSKKIAVGLKRLNVNNSGETIILKILNAYTNIRTIDQIFDLKENELKYLSLLYLYKELQLAKTKSIYDYEILSSLCIDGFGKEISKQLCKHINLYDLFYKTYDLSFIPNFGVERTNKLFEHIEENKLILDNLMNQFKDIKQLSKLDELNKKTICFSGEFPKSKKEYYIIAEQKGYKVVENVTKNLDILIIPESNFFSNKVEKAINYNIDIKTLDEFI